MILRGIGESRPRCGCIRLLIGSPEPEANHDAADQQPTECAVQASKPKAMWFFTISMGLNISPDGPWERKAGLPVAHGAT